MMDELAEKIGIVAANEFEHVLESERPKLLAWIDKLATLSDKDFFQETLSAIYDAVLTNRFRGNWSAESCRASAVHYEARRRYRLVHAESCRGTTAYDRAHAVLMREHGHTPLPETPCTCGVVKVCD